MRYYIAYGSNLNKEQMKRRCPGAKPVGTAVLKDWELLFRGSKTGAYLTIGERKGSTVPVAVWAITTADEAALDRYEGFPVFYYKREGIDLVCYGPRGGKKKVTAFVYIMHEERPLGAPSNLYLETCLRGYWDFGLDERALFEAARESEERRTA